MIKLNLDYQVRTLEDIFNDPDLDTMLEGLDDQQESKNNQSNKPLPNMVRAFTLLNFINVYQLAPPKSSKIAIGLLLHQPQESYFLASRGDVINTFAQLPGRA